MNILQVNDFDLPGRRFNGYDLNIALSSQGHSAKMAVLYKRSDDEWVELLTKHGVTYRRIASRAEKFFSMPGMISPFGKRLQKIPAFQRSEVVHYHLIHNYLISIKDLPMLMKAKPSVWSWHDPWAVTGHCVHPKDCNGWRAGCSSCPYLGEHFPLKIDCAGKLWKRKQEIYKKMDADIVVSSDFMMDFAKNSPLGQCFTRIHKIPFGVHIDQFGRTDACVAKERFGIPSTNFVVAFRCEKNPYKGTEYIFKMLERMPNGQNVSILTIGKQPLPAGISRRFHTVELGWQDDPQLLADFYSACDVFLMPSMAESFGLMAVEAMASSRPVICFEGTALPAVTFAPECGIAVAKGDVDALLATVRRLCDHPEEAQKRGELGRQKVEEHYKFEDYVSRHMQLYREVAVRGIR